MLILKMALRNLRRNLRRSSITAVAIAFGLALLVFSSGFADGAHGQMIDAGVQAMAGHVVVQGKGWQTKREVEILVPNSLAVARRVQELLPDATVVSRVYLQGLLTSPTAAVGVALSGVAPEVELQVNDIGDKIVEGEYIEAGGNGIVLGATLAETLDVGLGDKVVLMAQKGPDIHNQLFRVRGLFRMGIDEIDGFYAQIPLATAQEMLELGEDVTQITAHLDSHRQSRGATRVVREDLASAADIEVLSWSEALPELHEWVLYDEAGLYVMVLIIFIIVAMGITNTVLMSVLERMREFGVMLSLGATPGRLAKLVLAEATILGVVSVAIGVALGVAANAALAVNGVDFSQMMDMETMEAAGVAMDMHMFPDLSPVKVTVFAVLSLVMTLFAAIYPAIKAATLKPIQCLQHR